MPLTSALSQITLIVRAIPPENSWIAMTASCVKTADGTPSAVLMRVAI
jgi:hypothetical protein